MIGYIPWSLVLGFWNFERPTAVVAPSGRDIPASIQLRRWLTFGPRPPGRSHWRKRREAIVDRHVWRVRPNE